MLIRRGPGVELQLQAELLHVQSTFAAAGAHQEVYVGFHVKNVGTNAAVPSQVVINATASPTSSPAYGGVGVSTGTLIFGVPALAPGGFFDFSLPGRGIEVSELYVASSQPIAFSETIVVQVQSSQVADPAIGTVTLSDGCTGTYAQCTTYPGPPTFAPNNPGLLGTPIGLGYFYSSPSPDILWMGAYSPGTNDHLGTDPLYGGGVTLIDCSLSTPQLTDFPEVSSAETTSIVLDGKVVGACIPGLGINNRVPITLPPFDTNVHTLQLTFAGDGLLPPTVTPVVSFSYVLGFPKVPIVL